MTECTPNQLVSEKEITLQFLNDKYGKDSDYYVRADRSGISQVLSNLSNNAIKFTDTNGLIFVSKCKKDSNIIDEDDEENAAIKKEKKNNFLSALISIQDNGKEINPQIRSRLFKVCNKIGYRDRAGWDYSLQRV